MKKTAGALLLSLSAFLFCACGNAGETAPEASEEKASIVVENAEQVPSFETAEPREAEEPVAEEPEIISDTEPRQRDLDGDGIEESVFLREEETEDGWTCWSLAVTDAAGREYSHSSVIWSKARLRMEDLDCDGYTELFLWGDMGSDDPVLYCFRWADGALKLLDFDTGEETDDRLAPMDGCLEDVNGRSITVGAWQYVLGTYGGRRTFELGEDGIFRPAAGSIWEFSENTRWLTAKTELSGALEDGTSAVPQGTRVRLLGWDGVSHVFFETEDGRRGTFVLNRDPLSGWRLGGLSEWDCFEALPYAG